MREIIRAIEGEYERYKHMGGAVIGQLDAEALCTRPSPESNSVATIVWHVSGNLASRFTDFLTTDGEKEWREREDEFAVREESAEAVAARWEEGWAVLLATLAALDDGHLSEVVTIRGVELTVSQALQRSLAHTSYHVGQMTYVGKLLRGPDWDYLSIPPGGTAAYNEAPTLEKGYDAGR